MPNTKTATGKLRLTVRDHQAITEALMLADRLLADTKVCRCEDCNAMVPTRRALSEALAAAVLKALADGGEKGSPQYLAARKTQLAADGPEPQLPWVAAGGFAMPPTRVVYTKCVRTPGK